MVDRQQWERAGKLPCAHGGWECQPTNMLLFLWVAYFLYCQVRGEDFHVFNRPASTKKPCQVAFVLVLICWIALFHGTFPIISCVKQDPYTDVQTLTDGNNAQLAASPFARGTSWSISVVRTTKVATGKCSVRAGWQWIRTDKVMGFNIPAGWYFVQAVN